MEMVGVGLVKFRENNGDPRYGLGDQRSLGARHVTAVLCVAKVFIITPGLSLGDPYGEKRCIGKPRFGTVIVLPQNVYRML
jgi:hypothetical protein